MAKLLNMPPPTFTAKLFEVPWETAHFAVAGTLDGFIDLAVPQGGTYQLSLEVARNLAEALTNSVADIQSNCLYDRDILLAPRKE